MSGIRDEGNAKSNSTRSSPVQPYYDEREDRACGLIANGQFGDTNCVAAPKCYNYEQMLRQQHAQTSMSGKSAYRTLGFGAAKVRYPPILWKNNVLRLQKVVIWTERIWL